MLRTLLHRLRFHVRAAFAGLPLECIAVAVAVVSLWCRVASPDEDVTVRCILGAVLAVPLFYSVTILRRAERIPVRLAHALAGLSALAAIVMAASGPALDDVLAWRFGLVLLAAAMLPFVSAAAAAPRGGRLLGFADFVRRFSEETTASGLLWAAAILAAGVLFTSIQTLFGVRLERFGVDVGGAITGACVLAYLHRLLPGGAAASVPDLWRRLIARVAAPFLVAMLAVLAVYEVWVIARGELPVNLLSPLIIAAGAIGTASALVIESLVAVRTERTLSPADPHPWAGAGAVRLSRAFSAVLVLLLPLAAWALWIRIDQHGVTPARAARMYALVCLGLLALWGSGRWIRRRRPLTWEVPASIAVAALAAAIGPLSVVHLSIRSQADRLELALERAGLASRTVHSAPPATRVVIDRSAADEIAERIGVLAELGGTGALARVLGGDLAICRMRSYAPACLDHLGLSARDVPTTSPASSYVWSATGEVAGFHTLQVSLTQGESPALDGMTLSLRGNQLVASMGGSPLATADLSAYLDGWLASRTTGPIPPLLDPSGCARAHVLAHSAAIEGGPGGGRLVRLDLLWLVPIAPDCGSARHPD